MSSNIHINFLLLTTFLFPNIASATEISINEKLNICSSCHGIEGNSLDPLTPSLAGQDNEYLNNQLKAFKSGVRKNINMAGIAKSLTDEEILALASYFSSQTPKNIISDTIQNKQGKNKYSLCWSCHGERGEGPGSYPRIAGQHPQYTVQQLENFKNGVRSNSAMKAIVSNLSAEDMEALGIYISTF